jgi:hypothetical protein
MISAKNASIGENIRNTIAAGTNAMAVPAAYVAAAVSTRRILVRPCPESAMSTAIEKRWAIN